MEPEVKSGWRSTEWWAMLASQLGGLVAVVYAVTGRDDGKAAESVIKEAVTAAGGFCIAAVGLWQYIKARKEIKVAASEARAVVAVTESPVRLAKVIE
jgi:hypothetical protein